MTTTYRLNGHVAIDYAEDNGATLCKHGDAVDGARSVLTVSEAREIAAEDPSLVYCDVDPTDEQIDALRTAAVNAGDSRMVAICNRAFGGWAWSESEQDCIYTPPDEAARAQCAEAIFDAAGR